jgi:hypothetical protein
VTEDFTLRGAAGYVDAEFVEFIGVNQADPTGPLIDIRDTQNLRSGPDTTLSLGANYSRPILEGKLQLTLDATYSYQDEITTSRSQDPLGLGRDVLDSNDSTDFSVTVETLREQGPNLKVSAFINDAFDDDAGRLASNIVVPGTLTFSTGAPTKLYGFEATVDF